MRTPALSIITATTRCRARLLFSMVSNLGEQAARLSVPVEHLVISDGHDDLARALCADKTRYIECVPRQGVVGSNCKDRGIRESRGEWLWFADDDDYYTPDCLRTITENISTADDVDAIVFQFRRMMPDKQWVTLPPDYDGNVRVNKIGTPSVVIRRSFAIREKWDVQPPKRGADYTYWSSVWRHKPKSRFVEKVLVHSIGSTMD